MTTDTTITGWGFHSKFSFIYVVADVCGAEMYRMSFLYPVARKFQSGLLSLLIVISREINEALIGMSLFCSKCRSTTLLYLYAVNGDN